ncbi:hypothetical protein UQW22_04510 [Isoptericola halotolerans]|uniref:hypothetical protein n=1 Tax=Isoptericola halotolerans TaxID=300560 RepID=UPI00388D55B8
MSGDSAGLRGRVDGDLEAIRKLRNRMAHHEPVFARNLSSDLLRMYELVDVRSPETGAWVRPLTSDLPTLDSSKPTIGNPPR